MVAALAATGRASPACARADLRTRYGPSRGLHPPRTWDVTFRVPRSYLALCRRPAAGVPGQSPGLSQTDLSPNCSVCRHRGWPDGLSGSSEGPIAESARKMIS